MKLHYLIFLLLLACYPTEQNESKPLNSEGYSESTIEGEWWNEEENTSVNMIFIPPDEYSIRYYVDHDLEATEKGVYKYEAEKGVLTLKQVTVFYEGSTQLEDPINYQLTIYSLTPTSLEILSDGFLSEFKRFEPLKSEFKEWKN